jgi:hypothetical protein
VAYERLEALDNYWLQLVALACILANSREGIRERMAESVDGRQVDRLCFRSSLEVSTAATTDTLPT